MTASSSFRRPVAIIGAGEHAQVVLDICEAAGFSVAGFIAQNLPIGHAIGSLFILGDDRLLGDATFLGSHDLVSGVGDQAARRRTAQMGIAAGGHFPALFHPSAIVSARSHIAQGTVLCPGVIVNNGARLGSFCIVNTAASVDHDTVLEDAVQIAPGAILCGSVTCGEESFIGAGAVILPGIKVGARAIVGAGAIVTRDVAPGETVMGNPARTKL
jgi:sugar O-acyltransferase (sialic acid O-acetyltransferase NeuD family)